MQIFLLSTPRMGNANNNCAFRKIMLKYACLPGTSRGSKMLCDQKGKQRIDLELVRNKLIFINSYQDQWLKSSGRLGEISAAELRLRLHEERPTFLWELSEDIRILWQQNTCWELWPGVTLAASWEREEGGWIATRGRSSSQKQVQLHLSSGKMHNSTTTALAAALLQQPSWARSWDLSLSPWPSSSMCKGMGRRDQSVPGIWAQYQPLDTTLL